MKHKFLRLVKGKIKSDIGNQMWKIGEWIKCEDKLSMCTAGLHCSRTPYQAFSFVQGEVLAIVETKGKHIIKDDKEVWEQMKIVKAYKWAKKDSVAFAIYATELVLKNYEKEYPDDDTPRKAIEAAKKVLFKDTAKNRAAAGAAAWAATESAWAAWAAGAAARAAWAAARAATESAAGAAWAAAESAAESAAGAAAESAACAATESAWAATESAWAAARSAARSALYKKLGNWMVKHIKDLERIS